MSSALRLGPQHAALLAERAACLEAAAEEICRFRDMEPELAALCGLEVSALEAQGLLASGGPRRVAATSLSAARSGHEARLDPGDVVALARLETVVAMGNSRIASQMAAIDASRKTADVESVIGLATGVVGLFNSIF